MSLALLITGYLTVGFIVSFLYHLFAVRLYGWDNDPPPVLILIMMWPLVGLYIVIQILNNFFKIFWASNKFITKGYDQFINMLGLAKGKY